MANKRTAAVVTLLSFVPAILHSRYPHADSHIKREHVGAWAKGQTWNPRKEDGFFLYDPMDGTIHDALNERMWRCIKGRAWEAGSVWKEFRFVPREVNDRLGVRLVDLYN